MVGFAQPFVQIFGRVVVVTYKTRQAEARPKFKLYFACDTKVQNDYKRRCIGQICLKTLGPGSG